MNLRGKCDYCGCEGVWEGAIYGSPPGVADADDPNSRPEGWAASFPTRPIPRDIAERDWMSPANCEKLRIDMLLQCPACRGKTGFPVPTETVEIGGVLFEHGYSALSEYYVHRDGKKRNWHVFRHLTGQMGTERVLRIRMAVVEESGPQGQSSTLNSAMKNAAGELEKDALFDMPSMDNPTPLLEAVGELIKKDDL